MLWLIDAYSKLIDTLILSNQKEDIDTSEKYYALLLSYLSRGIGDFIVKRINNTKTYIGTERKCLIERN